MGHLLGLHWQRQHSDNRGDFAHIKAMGYKSFTLFKNEWDNKDFCADLLKVAAPDAIFLLRDHALSEEKGAFASDPAGTGSYHALQWDKKWREGNVHLPKERCYHLGINEPDSNFQQVQINTYTVNFAKALASFGLLCAGFSFGVGHPSTKNLDPKGIPDWSWYDEAVKTLMRLNGIAAVHEYWWKGDYQWGSWVGRYMEHCPYDLKYVVKESFHDGGVVGRPREGFHHNVDLGNAESIKGFLDEIQHVQSRLSKDPRFHSLQGFTYDFAQPWATFDIRPIAHHFESYPWTTAREQITTHIPVIGKDIFTGSGGLGAPLSGQYHITQRFGENPKSYARFGIPGHNGLDLSSPQGEGQTVTAIYDGVVEWVGEDKDYGNYVRIFHPSLKLHSFYAHLREYTARMGQRVQKGEMIGVMGSSGNSTGPHLHLEIRLADKAGGYQEGQYGYGKGRVDPETVYHILNRG